LVETGPARSRGVNWQRYGRRNFLSLAPPWPPPLAPRCLRLRRPRVWRRIHAPLVAAELEKNYGWLHRSSSRSRQNGETDIPGSKPSIPPARCLLPPLARLPAGQLAHRALHEVRHPMMAFRTTSHAFAIPKAIPLNRGTPGPPRLWRASGWGADAIPTRHKSTTDVKVAAPATPSLRLAPAFSVRSWLYRVVPSGRRRRSGPVERHGHRPDKPPKRTRRLDLGQSLRRTYPLHFARPSGGLRRRTLPVLCLPKHPMVPQPKRKPTGRVRGNPSPLPGMVKTG